MEYPDDLRYLDSHEYVRLDGEIATIGLSAYVVEQLGDITSLDLPDVGDIIEVGERFGTIESANATEYLYPPISGTVIECNEVMVDSPDLIAEDPYGEGWLLKIRVANLDDELADTMSADEYRSQVEGEE